VIQKNTDSPERSSERTRLTVVLTPNVIHGLLADDTTIWNTQTDLLMIKDTLQEGLNVVIAWSKKYLQPLNMAKTELILFTNYAPDHAVDLNISMGDLIIPFSKEVGLLGIRLDSQLNFTARVDKRQKSCNNRLRQLSMTSGYN
jgi:hypothetical protein